jgi:SAM-dependent methyltransferase
LTDADLQTCTPPDSTVYYNSTYWNDLPPVIEHISEICTGDRQKWWVPGFKERYCERGPFEHGLFLACGNGWVEREFVDWGIVRRATAFDYSTELLRAAERERGERDITYFQADANTIDFEPDSFDLIVNVGALHHVQYLDRLCRILCKALTADGLLVGYDYVGPSRNQYSRRHWRLIRKTNESLPPFLRKDTLTYPHLPTMVATDPTEAIHSDMELPVLGRYFSSLEHHDLGGGIAYEVLSHNEKLDAVPAEELAPELENLLELDRSLTASGRIPTLFSYYVLSADKRTLAASELDRFRREENRREALASRFMAAYSVGGFLKLFLHRNYYRARSRPRLLRFLRRVAGRVKRRLGRALGRGRR